MRSQLTRPEAALAGLVGLVLAAGAVSAVALPEEDGTGSSSAARSTRSPDPGAPASASASASASPQVSPSATAPRPQQSPADDGRDTPPTSSPEAPPPPSPEQRPPEQVAVAFFDAAVQGRDADALVVAEAQALSDLREYEAWDSHQFAGCEPEKGHAVCVFEAQTTFLRLVLTPDPTTDWRVLSIE